MGNVFDKITKSVFIDEIITCPFCGRSYTSEDEKRQAGLCPVCEGIGAKAEKATSEVEGIIGNISSYSTRQIEEMISKLAPGLEKAEMRAHIIKK